MSVPTNCRTGPGKIYPILGTIELNQVVLFYWIHDQAAYGGSPMPNRWHRDLADRLCHGSAEQADAAMRAHVNDRLEVLMRNLEAYLTINLDRMSTGSQNRP